MKNATACTKKLNSLIKKLPAASPVEFPDDNDPVAVLVQSFLLWETTSEKALTAYKRLRKSVVDFNDLRVSMPFEVVELIGARYPKAQDRCERLRASLRDLYLREHAVCFDGVVEKGKRDVKKYVESLDGITPYVAGRLLLLSFSVHHIPVDEQLRARLIDEGAGEAEMSVGDMSNWLARQIKAEDGLATHHAFQAWTDKPRGKSNRGTTAGRAANGKKKTTSKKSTAEGGAKSGSKSAAAKAAN